MSAPPGTVLLLYSTFSPGVTFSLAQYFSQILCRAKHEVQFMCDLWVAAHVKWCPAQPQPRGINKWVLRLCKTLRCAEIRSRIRMLHGYSTILTDKIVTVRTRSLREGNVFNRVCLCGEVSVWPIPMMSQEPLPRVHLEPLLITKQVIGLQLKVFLPRYHLAPSFFLNLQTLLDKVMSRNQWNNWSARASCYI